MKFCHEILETLRYHAVKTRSLSRLASNRYRVVTDGQDRHQDRITVANTRYSYYIYASCHAEKRLSQQAMKEV